MPEQILERCRKLQAELEAESRGSAVPGSDLDSPVRQTESELQELVEKLLGASGAEIPILAGRLKEGIHLLALRARVNKARAEAFAEELGDAADGISQTMSNRVSEISEKVAGLTDADQAAIEITREMHTSKGTMKEILQSLLMWKETPEERLAKKQES